jgi:hypothetical protein
LRDCSEEVSFIIFGSAIAKKKLSSPCSPRFHLSLLCIFRILKSIYFNRMKKTILILLSVILLPTASFASTKTDFLQAIEKTFKEDFTLTGGNMLGGSLNGGDIFSLTTEDHVARKDENWEAHREFMGQFDLSPIATFADDESIPNITGEMHMGSDMYYQKDSGIMQARLRDFDLIITSEEGPYADIIGGIMEMLKVFQSQYMVLNIPEILDVIAEYNMEEEMQVLKSQLAYTQSSLENPGETIADMLGIILDSGILQISKSSSQYILELQQDPEKLQLQELADIFAYMGMDEDMVAEIAEGLETQNEEVQEIWADLLDMLTLTIRFSHSAGEITFFQAEFKYRFEQVIPQWDYETWEVVDEKTLLLEYEMTSKFMVQDEADRIVFPTGEPTISFAKILRAVGAMAGM